LLPDIIFGVGGAIGVLWSFLGVLKHLLAPP